MRKKVITTLYLAGFGLMTIATILAINGSIPTQPNPALTWVAQVLLLIGISLFFVSFGGALYNSVRAGRWGWFACVLILNWAGLLVYLFVGPGPAAALPGSAAPKYQNPAVQKKTIVILYFVGLFLLIPSSVMIAITLASGPPTNVPSYFGLLFGLLGAYFVGFVLVVISWIGVLRNLARAALWGWFVWVLLLNIVAMLAYLFFDPVSTQKSNSTAPQG